MSNDALARLRALSLELRLQLAFALMLLASLLAGAGLATESASLAAPALLMAVLAVWLNRHNAAELRKPQQLVAPDQTKEAERHAAVTQLALDAQALAQAGSGFISDAKARQQSIAALSRRVVEIAPNIERLAARTQVLALNAATQSARGRESRQELAVAAIELSRLAHQATTAAKEVAALMRSGGGHLDTGGALVAGGGGTMNELLLRLSKLMAQMAHIAGDPLAGDPQLGDAATAIEAMAQQNRARLAAAPPLAGKPDRRNSGTAAAPHAAPTEAAPAEHPEHAEHTDFIDRRSPESTGARLRSKASLDLAGGN